jgi:hypothetical protein
MVESIEDDLEKTLGIDVEGRVRSRSIDHTIAQAVPATTEPIRSSYRHVLEITWISYSTRFIIGNSPNLLIEASKRKQV